MNAGWACCILAVIAAGAAQVIQTRGTCRTGVRYGECREGGVGQAQGDRRPTAARRRG